MTRCPYCGDPAPLPDHLWAKWRDGGCKAACFQWDKYTPYLGNLAASDRDDATVFRPRQARHLRLGKVGYSASRRHDDGACSVKGCAEPRAIGRSMCREHEGERRRARRAEGRDD